MFSVLAGIRYALFALYIICSGVLVTAAAWHLGLANTIGAAAQLDAYIIFLGAFGLFFVLAITFIDTLRKHAVTSAVWFELAWIGLFWVFYLAAASAVTAIGPPEFCAPAAVNVLGWKDACSAIKLILGFTWLGTVAFLTHLFTLLVLSLLHAPHAPGVWHSGVRDFPWLDFTARPSFRNSVSANHGVRMGSEPSSPNKYHYERRGMGQSNTVPVSVQPIAPIHARMARTAYAAPAQIPAQIQEPYAAHPFASTAISRPAPVHDLEASQLYQYKPERDPRAKTQSQAIVEQFRAGKVGQNQDRNSRVPGQVQSSIVRALPRLPTETASIAPLQPVRKQPPTHSQSQSRSYQQSSSQPASLYPLHVQSTMGQSQGSVASHSSEPQPLGDWPRRNPPADIRRDRSNAPPAWRPMEHTPATIPSAGAMTTSGAQERVNRRIGSMDSAMSSSSSVDSNGVARRRDGRPKHRPPPLDFSKLNAGRQ